MQGDSREEPCQETHSAGSFYPKITSDFFLGHFGPWARVIVGGGNGCFQSTWNTRKTTQNFKWLSICYIFEKFFFCKIELLTWNKQPNPSKQPFLRKTSHNTGWACSSQNGRWGRWGNPLGKLHFCEINFGTEITSVLSPLLFLLMKTLKKKTIQQLNFFFQKGCSLHTAFLQSAFFQKKLMQLQDAWALPEEKFPCVNHWEKNRSVKMCRQNLKFSHIKTDTRRVQLPSGWALLTLEGGRASHQAFFPASTFFQQPLRRGLQSPWPKPTHSRTPSQGEAEVRLGGPGAFIFLQIFLQFFCIF